MKTHERIDVNSRINAKYLRGLSEYSNARQIKQIGSRQLFTVITDKAELLVSYKTVIALRPMGTSKFFVDDHRYSVTTTRQLNYFINEYKDFFTFETVNSSIFDTMKNKYC